MCYEVLECVLVWFVLGVVGIVVEDVVGGVVEQFVDLVVLYDLVC